MDNKSLNHKYSVATLDSETREVIYSVEDFAEDARFDWFEQTCDFTPVSETVQLVDTESNTVILEEIGRQAELGLNRYE